MKLPLKLNETIRVRVRSKGKKPGEGNYSSAHKYYAKLTTETIQKLIALFEQDFVFFQYDPRPFLEMAKDYNKTV